MNGGSGAQDGKSFSGKNSCFVKEKRRKVTSARFSGIIKC